MNMNQKGFANIVLVVVVVILVGVVGYFAFVKKSEPIAQQTTPTPTTTQTKTPTPTPTPKDETLNWKIYRNEQYGVEIKHPQSWYAYGDKSAFANTDVLSWRGFVPDYDANKSVEQQELFSVTVYNKNPNSTFDAPKRFITKTRTDEKWEQVTINGYTGTKITNTTTNKVTDYVFERSGRLYEFNASQASLFDKILPTLKFF